MTDLDQLLRDTLHGRAATVTEAPPVPSDPPGASRSRWLLVAATVALVLAAGGGVAVWGLNRGHDAQESGGGYARTCSAELPSAWKAAFTAPPLTTAGKADLVAEVTPFGDVVEQSTYGGGTRIGLRAPDSTVRVLYQVAAGTTVTGTSADGAYLVLSLTSGDPQVSSTRVDDIVAIDLRTAAIRHVLRTAVMPAGTVVADKAAAVLDGVVYWVAVPRGTQGDGAPGVVLAETLSTGRARQVGHAPNLLSGPDDPRGVYWAGGGVAAAHVPSSVPPLRADGYDPVVSDGKTFAWLRAADPQVIGWADSRGDERRWSVDTVGRRDIRSDPMAVSGPFVFLEPMGYGNPRFYVLDTRTGAVADSGIQAYEGTAAGTRVALLSTTGRKGALATVAFDTATLPELRCR